jgi:hypothetical protein
MAGPRTGLLSPRFLVPRDVLPRLHGVARTLVRRSILPLWLLTMPRKRTRRLFGTFVALDIMLAGGALIYSGWQSKPGREEILALGIGMAIGGLVLVVWFGR